MAAREIAGRRQALPVDLEINLAYEFLMTLCVYSDVEGRHTYAVGKEWFDAVQAKATPELAENVEQFSFHSHEIWEHMLGLVYDCPPPRDVPAFIAFIEAMEPLELRLHLLGYYVREHRRMTPPEVIYQAASGDEEAQKRLIKTSFPDDASWQRTLRWLLSLDTLAMKNRLVEIFRCWYDEVFREQEARILPVLERDAEAKRALKPGLSAEQFIAAATGMEYVPDPGVRRVVLIPSYVLRPWNSSVPYRDTMIFIYGVAEESVAGDSSAPPARLLLLAKALADERRLRLLKKLSQGCYTLQELADEFDVAKTTLHHHLVTLRSVGLVRVRMSDNRYCLRREMLDNLDELLNRYLS
jgi:DNA-binding transcriptional ArsR family regulator